MSGFLMKSIGECCGNTMLMVACYWSSSNCIPAQKFMTVSEELNHRRLPWVMHSDKEVVKEGGQGGHCTRFRVGSGS